MRSIRPLSVTSSDYFNQADYNFTLGQLYERSGTQDHLKAAREHYEIIVMNYPASPLRREAENRLAYLDRFFFLLR